MIKHNDTYKTLIHTKSGELRCDRQMDRFSAVDTHGFDYIQHLCMYTLNMQRTVRLATGMFLLYLLIVDLHFSLVSQQIPM